MNNSYQNHSLENFFSTNLAATDDAVFAGIQAENTRQNEQIELIASENIVSKAVMQAQGTCLTNKYAEGYPGRRYYGGCEHVDTVEAIAIERAKQLLNANTQTFNLTLALKQMAQLSWLYCNLAIPY